MTKGYKHLTWENRLTIERMLRKGYRAVEIADAVGCCRATVYNELKRGEYIHTLGKDILTEEKRYSSELAEQKYQDHKRTKHKGLKIDADPSLITYIEDKIVKEKYSPAAVLMAIKMSPDLKFCVEIKSVNTIYNYIRRGDVFDNLTMIECPYRMRKVKKNRIIRNKRNKNGRSIEQRPAYIDERSEFGHWEMDTVHGKRTNKKCLLVLTERKTRYELIEVMKSCTAEETVKALNRIEKRIGSSFYRLFKTITVDNGKEFMDDKGIEKALYRVGNRSVLYYCHPYSSSERGSNENQNKLIRRFYPKGCDFDKKISKKDVKDVQDWINNYPRQIFNGEHSASLFGSECQLLNLQIG